MPDAATIEAEPTRKRHKRRPRSVIVPPPQPSSLLTLDEVAAYLRIAPIRVSDEIHKYRESRGKMGLAYFCPGTRGAMVTGRALFDWIERKQAEAALRL